MRKNKKVEQTIKEWVKDNKMYKWKIDGDTLKRKGDCYISSISLRGLQNCCIESGELCLAFERGQMVWCIEDSISTEYEPDNQLFKEEV